MENRKIDQPSTRIAEPRKSSRSYNSRSRPTTQVIDSRRVGRGVLDRSFRSQNVPWYDTSPTVIDRVNQEHGGYYDYGDDYDHGYDDGYDRGYDEYHYDYDYDHDGHYYDSHYDGRYGHDRGHGWRFRFSFRFGSLGWRYPYHHAYYATYYPRYHSSYCRSYAGYGWYDCYCDLPSYSYDTTTYIVYDEPLDYAIPEPVLPSIDDAWAHLGDGYIEAAQAMFSELVYALPYEGAPRIGYAITTGLMERDSAAVDAMRRALIDEPEALQWVPDDPLVREQIRILLDVYADRAREDFGDIDALFMVAALRFMLDDTANAYFAIDTAIINGDEDASALNLKAMINHVLQEDL